MRWFSYIPANRLFKSINKNAVLYNRAKRTFASFDSGENTLLKVRTPTNRIVPIICRTFELIKTF